MPVGALNPLFLTRRIHIFIALALTCLASFASAFSFTYTTPSQCDDITVKWKGGKPPFRLLVIPPSQTIKNFSIPSSSFKDNEGSYTTRLELGVQTRVMFAMSDATGVTAGGISPLLTVGSSVSGSSCNTAIALPDFFFSLDSDLEECKPYMFTQYTNAVQPVTILGFIPSGDYFSVEAPLGDSYGWPNTYAAGTSVAFSMVDSTGRSGGTASIKTVMSGDKSCLANTTSSSASPTPTKDASSPSSTESASEGTVNLIIGVAVTVGGVLALVGGLIWFFCWRRRKARLAKAAKDKMGPYELLAPGFSGLAPEGAPELVGRVPDRMSVTPFPPPTPYRPPIISVYAPSNPQAVTPFPLPVPMPHSSTSSPQVGKLLYHEKHPSSSSLTLSVSTQGASSSVQAGSSRQGLATTATYRDPFIDPITPPANISTSAASSGPYNLAIEDSPPEYTEETPPIPPSRPSFTSLQPMRR